MQKPFTGHPGPDDGRSRVNQDHFDVVLEEDGIVWLRRRPVAFRTIDEVHRAYDAFLATVDAWLEQRGELVTRRRARFAWLYDTRDAPTQRDDPEFQAVIGKRYADLVERSSLIAVLVETAGGEEQLNRMVRPTAGGVLVFTDPLEARDQLRWRMQLAAEVGASR